MMERSSEAIRDRYGPYNARFVSLRRFCWTPSLKRKFSAMMRQSTPEARQQMGPQPCEG